MTLQSSSQPRIPEPVRELVARLQTRDHGAWIVGESAHDLLLDREPARFALATSASAEELIRLFPTAVQTVSAGRCLLVPTVAAPVDLLPLPAGAAIEACLSGRELTILALAYSVPEEKWIDPHGGIDDARERRLRAIGDPRARLRAEPRCALRAIRLATCDGYALDPELHAAISEVAPECAVARSPHGPRRELSRILLAPEAARGLELLRATGLQAAIAPKVDADAPTLVGAQPPVLALRLLAWLRGASAGRVMRHLRYPLNVSQRVLHLLQSHPLERSATGHKRTSVQRLARRLDPQERAALADLREREIEAQVARGAMPVAEADAARRALQSLTCAIERFEQEEQAAREAKPLALDGRDIMRILEAAPGREVGTLLRRMREAVADDASLNTEDALTALLLGWREGAEGEVAAQAEPRDIAPGHGSG